MATLRGGARCDQKPFQIFGIIATFILAERQELCLGILLLMESRQCALVYCSRHRQNWRCSFSSVVDSLRLRVCCNDAISAMPLIRIPEMGFELALCRWPAVELETWSRGAAGALVLRGAATAGM
jgi:hypothetical protein